jgi:hypothetical protein
LRISKWIIYKREIHNPWWTCPYSTASSTKAEIVHQEITEMITDQSLEEVMPTYGKGFYSCIFVVPKPNG